MALVSLGGGAGINNVGSAGTGATTAVGVGAGGGTTTPAPSSLGAGLGSHEFGGLPGDGFCVRDDTKNVCLK
jgi:hypothetical protein